MCCTLTKMLLVPCYAARYDNILKKQGQHEALEQIQQLRNNFIKTEPKAVLATMLTTALLLQAPQSALFVRSLAVLYTGNSIYVALSTIKKLHELISKMEEDLSEL